MSVGAPTLSMNSKAGEWLPYDRSERDDGERYVKRVFQTLQTLFSDCLMPSPAPYEGLPK